MVWGAISYDKKSRLCFVSGNLNSQGYTQLLTSHYKPFERSLKLEEPLFQQDNAPCHVSKFTRDFMEAKNIDPMIWPPQSPDLNPIENVWAIMKAKVAKRSPNTMEELKIAIQAEWDAFSVVTLRRLNKGMSARVDQCLRNKGLHVRK